MLSLSNLHNNVASLQKNRGDKSRRVTVALIETRLKPTSHSTIFDIPMRPVRKDQRHRRRFTR